MKTLTAESKTDLTGAIVKRGVQVAVILVVYGALMFIPAGRLSWIWAWAYLGIYLAVVVANMLILLPRDPELIAERGETKEGTKSWDKALSWIVGVPMMASLVVAGLDERFAWPPQFAVMVNLIGLVLTALGNGLFSWAMISNAFFSKLVRVQGERGHAVATGGPYRFVRHPGYVGMIVQLLAVCLLLGSLWALVPAVLAAAGFVVRTALEDKTLQAELDGYRDYAAKVRYRLLPGVW